MAIRGFLEFASVNSVRGWAYDADAPAEHVEIIVRDAATVYATASADIQRRDLAAAGIGDGSHGFNIDITTAQISPEVVGTLEVHAALGADTVKLSRVASKSSRIVNLVSDAQMPVTDEAQFPVFVLGPARSGTSAIALALLDSGQYVGTGEGHLLPLAHALLANVDNYYRDHAGDHPDSMLGRVPRAAFQMLLRRCFVQLARELFPTPSWLDKTPTVEMVRAAPLMKELWPNARFIFMKRRVIENVLSRRRKFPQDSTSAHFSDWAAVMTAWLAVRDTLADAALEIEHRQLVLNPKSVASEIAAFLQLPDEPSQRLVRLFDDKRPEQTDKNFGAIYDLEQLSLSDDDAKRLLEKCDPLMVAFGYSYDNSYFS